MGEATEQGSQRRAGARQVDPRQTFELSDEHVLALGREAQAICYTTAEHREAVAAFLNRK